MDVGTLTDARVWATFGGNMTAEQRVRFDLSVFDADGSGAVGGGGGPAGGGNPINPGIDLQLTDSAVVPTGGGQCTSRSTGNECDASITFTNRNASTGWDVQEMRVSAYAAQGDVGPTTFVVGDVQGSAEHTLSVNDDFAPVPDLDDVGPDGSANDEQTYYLRFSGFTSPTPSGGSLGDSVKLGDLFVVELRIENDSGKEAAVTYIVTPAG